MKSTTLTKILSLIVVLTMVFSLASCSLITNLQELLGLKKDEKKPEQEACQHANGEFTEYVKKGNDYFGVCACTKCGENLEVALNVVTSSDKWLYDENSHWNQFKYTEGSAKDAKAAKLNVGSHAFDESGVCQVCHYNSSVSVGLDYVLNASGDGYIVVGRGECRDEHINIPNKHNDLPVVEIGDNAFADIVPEEKSEESATPYKAEITVEEELRVLGVTIPDTVISISCTAFSDCAELNNFIVDLANTVYSSVDNCLINTVLKSVVRGCEFSVIPSDGQVTAIGSYAFAGSTGLVSITIPDTVEDIGDKAFMECDALIEVYMPENINVGIDVFRGSIHVEIIVEHTLEFVPAKEATCEESGNVAYYVCTDCGYYYSDADANDRIYEVTIPASHEFENGVCSKCNAVQDQWLIVSVAEIAHLGKFPLGTLEDAIGLPLYAQVTTKDGNVHQLPIIWDTTGYDKSVAGEYTITGVIQSGNFRYDEGLSNKLSVGIEMVEKIVGTADIVFVLDISGSMSDEIYNVKENLKAFAQAIEDAGVSARWSVITYSDFSDVPDDPKEITQVRKNNGNDWSTNADDCKAVIESIEIAFGGDGPEVAVDGLMMANSLDNRKNARVFYILLTDADYKIANNYGIESMDQAVEKILEKDANVSVITSYYSSLYSPITEATGGIMCDIYGNFGYQLTEALVPIIYGEVIA